jgi:glycosyltransferase involved in cell wall biosynthesis
MTRAVPSVAAVIPTYQREQTIARAIESVLAQSRPPSEVIVVDDGSTDRTGERLREFGDAIRVVVQTQSGSAAARNRGVEAASAEWIAFLDSDDRWEPDHLERIVDAIVATGGEADLYFDDTEVAFEMFDDGDGSLRDGSLWELAGFDAPDTAVMAPDASAWVLLPMQPMMLQSSVVRRARYLELGGMRPDLRLRHDTHLFFLLGLGRPACAVPGTGVRMTDDGGDDRLTRGVTPLSRPYWEESARLYGDLAGRWGRRSDCGRVLGERLATAHWRLARIDLAERGARTAIGPLLASFRAKPLFIPRRVLGHVSGRRGHGAHAPRPAA